MSVLDKLRTALNDRYRIDREVGAGGMATVYLAHDIRHDRNVAIKVLHPDLAAALGAERFLSEGNAHLLATDAHHPRRRPPLLAEAREAAAKLVGELEADHLVSTRPQGIVDNLAPDDLPALPDSRPLPAASRAPSFWNRLRGAA